MREKNNKTEKKKNQSINIKETYTMYTMYTRWMTQRRNKGREEEKTNEECI